ncbi:4-(cytidine 5'-diphospho)-2-C-methyl-D-erythritol kinase [Shimia sp. SDUM112013]|uniref:4-(cytidine 5'-diphospho)-2-C-methyl-D-erythritol kinase n=1 Tax=Shimia sp. SDUM112013 TaxID=3136160 RepID=UPI0032EBA3BC
MKTEAFAPAKINLTLHVTGQRADGYHLLDSLVVFADVGDRITVAPSDRMQLTVTGPRSDGVPSDDSNLVMQAAALLADEQKAAITLEKHLPAAAGIGGGSSDAAATLRALSDLWQCSLPDTDQVLSLGADLPVCLTPQAQRMSGIGETLSPVGGLPACDILLVNPGVEVSTPAIFRALTRRTNPPMPISLPDFPTLDMFANWLATQRNDLQPAAVSLQPEIAIVLDAIDASGSLFTAMSGSGATCFGLFPSDGRAANAARAAIAARHPEWWCACGRML